MTEITPAQRRAALDEILDGLSPAFVAGRMAMLFPHLGAAAYGLSDEQRGVQIICGIIDDVFHEGADEMWWATAVQRAVASRRASTPAGQRALDDIHDHLIEQGLRQGWTMPELDPAARSGEEVRDTDARSSELLHTAMTCFYIGGVSLLFGIGLLLIPINPPETAHTAGWWLIAGAVVVLIFGGARRSESARLFEESRRGR